MSGGMRHILDERRQPIEARADAVLDTARDAGAAWTGPLREPPRDPRKIVAWRSHDDTIAVHRDRCSIAYDTPLGTARENAAQKIDRARAGVTLRQLAGQPEPRRQH